MTDIKSLAEEAIRKMVAENFDAERAYRHFLAGDAAYASMEEDGTIRTDYVTVLELYKREPNDSGGIRIRSEYFFL